MKKALITGITGQDGAYLAEFLLDKGYEVHGIKRRSSLLNTQRVDHLYQDTHNENVKFKMYYGDLVDTANIMGLIQAIQPDEIYNLGAMSHVKISFDMPEYTANVDALGTLRLLEGIRALGLAKKTKFYQASTSELYGQAQEVPQNEKTPFYPRSPYAVAKLYSYWITVNYREAYGLFASNGILFNHESPIRGETFVTRKITRAACRIVLGHQKKMYIGNLGARRDWGHAKDYVRAMWKMMQQDHPDDFVIATGVTTSVRDFILKAFQRVGIQLEFRGKGVEEKGYVLGVSSSDSPVQIGDIIIHVDEHYFRPTEVDLLIGDASKAKRELGWTPKFNLDDLISDMVESDMALFKKQQSSTEEKKRSPTDTHEG